MEPFSAHTGIMAPLRRIGVDTDQIIPAEYMKRVTRSGYEDALFASWRQDPTFVLNIPPFDRASILVAGAGFGSGSSREHAVWALRDGGFRVILAPSFADIFRGNAGKQGLLAATVDEGDTEALWSLAERAPHTEVTVDLASRTVRLPDRSVPFGIDDYTRWRLLEGLDDIDLTLRHSAAVAAFEARRPAWLPRTLPARAAEEGTSPG